VSSYGPRVHPITGRPGFHRGVDLPVALGAPVYAVTDGLIVGRIFEDSPGGELAGNAVFIGRDGWTFGYLHLLDVAVLLGQAVYAGDVIGYAGATGRVTGPHLHFEIRAPWGAYLDPAPYLESAT
jgi:murein DD-endopeptidase MepM/ murein hydrolase activator NlpD